MAIEVPSSITKRLNFDEPEELKEDSPEQDASITELSILRHRMDKMDVDDDSLISRNSYIGSSPEVSKSINDLHDESGLSMSISPPPKSRTFYCSTPAPTKLDFRRGKRLTYGEVPRTPIKENRFRPRISMGDFGLDGGIYGIQEEQCNVNPFSDDADFMESPKCERLEQEVRKRPFTEVLSTPVAQNPNRAQLTPESGYESRHKVLKQDKVHFNLGSPSVSPIPPESSPTNRYTEEFVELETIGAGNFGRVTKVRKRLDGVIYSIKRTRDEVQKLTKDAVTEVFALAALGSHPNVLRYFSSWVQDNHLYIQSEYCDAGTLADRIKINSGVEVCFQEDEIRRITCQCASGLAFLHEQMLVHLDVKPDNILMTHRRRTSNPKECEISEDDRGRFIYKIGDLGHVRSFRSGPVSSFADGDKRYLAPEILHQMDAVLYDPPKADVYSLGASVERTSLSRDFLGPAQRNGILPGIENFPLCFNQLIQKMTSIEPSDRPTMYEVVSSPAVEKPSTMMKCPSIKIAHVNGMNSVKPKILLLGRRLKNRSASNQF